MTLWTATLLLAAAAGAVVVAPPQTTLKAPTPSPLRQSYESPALEPILLDRSSSLEEKIGWAVDAAHRTHTHQGGRRGI